jgi:hypothetical protein
MMIRYMKNHEDHIRAMLAADVSDCDWKEPRRLHGIWIGRMQHKKLIHLLVTFFCALFFRSFSLPP